MAHPTDTNRARKVSFKKLLPLIWPAEQVEISFKNYQLPCILSVSSKINLKTYPLGFLVQ